MQGFPLPTPTLAADAQTMHGSFELQVEQFPDSLAVRTPHHRMTYATLNARANGLARQIQALVPQRSFVVSLLEDSIDILVTILAISKAGCVWVALERRLPPAVQRSILNQFEPSACITRAPYDQTAHDILPELPLIMMETAEQAQTAENLALQVRSDDLFCLFFTSGTTGTPKGIARTHIDQLCSAVSHMNDLGFTSADRLVLFGSMNFAGGFANTCCALLRGGMVDLLDLNTMTPEMIFEWIEREAVTVFFSPPSLYRVIFAVPPVRPLTNLRLVRLGSEPVLQADLELFKRCFPTGQTHFSNVYASTEVSYLTHFQASHTTHIDTPLVPVGRPPSFIELSIVNDDLQPLPAGEAGEIVVRKPYMPNGYWRSPEQSAGKFSVDPAHPAIGIFRTGDLGVMQADGNLLHLGRRDSMVKIRGFRVELSAIENALRRHPQIEAAAVQTIAEGSGTRLVAYIVPRVKESLTSGELRASLTVDLPDFMIPSQFIFLDTLPLLPNGKLNPLALPVPEVPKPTSEVIQTPTEARLLPLLQQALNAVSASRDDNFFDLGGDSLSAMRFISEVNAKIGVTLTPAAIYKYPTVALLASYLDAGHPPLSPLIALNPYGKHPPILCIPGQVGNALHMGVLAAELGHDFPVYAYHNPGRERNAKQFSGLAEFAQYYLELASNQLGDQPYYLLGYSVGGLVSYEMAWQLSAAGKAPLGVFILDSHFSGEEGVNLRRKISKVYHQFKRQVSADAEEWVRARVTAYMTRITAGYVPRPFAGTVYYMTCREDRRRSNQAVTKSETEWKQVVTGKFEVLDVDGSHIDMLTQPHVRSIARHIRRIASEKHGILA